MSIGDLPPEFYRKKKEFQKMIDQDPSNTTLKCSEFMQIIHRFTPYAIYEANKEVNIFAIYYCLNPGINSQENNWCH